MARLGRSRGGDSFLFGFATENDMSGLYRDITTRIETQKRNDYGAL